MRPPPSPSGAARSVHLAFSPAAAGIGRDTCSSWVVQPCRTAPRGAGQQELAGSIVCPFGNMISSTC
jgi:hypothetical protein